MKRLTAATAGLACAALVAGCGTGLHNQTYKNRDEANSVNAQASTTVFLRNLAVAAPPSGSYPVGGSAVVTGQLSNRGTADDQLLSATSDSARVVVVLPAGATSGGSASPVPSAVTTARPAATPGASVAPSAGSVPSASPDLVSTPIDLPAAALATPGWSLVLTGLTSDLRSGEYVTLHLQFARAGSVTVIVPVAPGDRAVETTGPTAIPGFQGDAG